jgi:hypothetical protein
MRRWTFAAAPLALAALLSAACGGDDEAGQATGDDAAATPTLSAADAQRTAVAAQDQPQVPDTPLAKPTPVPSDAPVVQVVAGQARFAPTKAEFEALPTAEIQANGKTVKGVTIATLASRAGAGAGAVVTIQGTRADNLRLGAVRFALSEIGENTVVTMDDEGHLALASSFIPPEQWLNTLTGIAFN